MERRSVPDSAIVIRGGKMLSADLLKNAEAHHEDFPNDGFAISVFVGIGMSAAELAASIPLPQRTVRWVEAARLRQAGFRIAFDDETSAHANLYLPKPPDDDLWTVLRGLFDRESENPNPAPRSRGEQSKESP